MRRSLVLLLVLATVAAGCIQQTAPPDPVTPSATSRTGGGDPGDDAAGGAPSDDGNETGADDGLPPATNRTAGDDADDTPAQDAVEPVDAGPQVVIAHVDSGINPYHAAFRDESPLAHVHPSRYIPDFPEDARALNLTLDAPTWEEAFEKDADAWANVTEGELYWIPGTRIVGAITLGAGGTSCQFTDLACAVNETPILDDHGHGTMTASRMAAAEHSLCPTCRIVSVEGLGAASVRWIADQGWIDVQTNSWLSLIPHPVGDVAGDDTRDAFAYAARRMVTLAASGNGAAYTQGVAPTPTYVLSTGAQGVVLVGAHDNGKVAPWSGSPPHVIADGYGGWHADHRSLDAYSTRGVACCSSAASPYAAGGAAALILEARTHLDHEGTGIRYGVVAQGEKNLTLAGPLTDGRFTVEEFRDAFLKTATPRPGAQVDDGRAQWAGEPRAPEDPASPGGNPYCPGCWTVPVDWQTIPEGAYAYPLVGYGAIDVESREYAEDVLAGFAPLPARAEDAVYERDQAARRAP